MYQDPYPPFVYIIAGAKQSISVWLQGFIFCPGFASGLSVVLHWKEKAAQCGLSSIYNSHNVDPATHSR